MTSAATSARVKPRLTGVPETLLWPLYNRAEDARRASPVLSDPRAIELVDAIDYPFREHFGRAWPIFSFRALHFDREIRAFLEQHPDGTVVALGEGLETQFYRVDNGRVRWLMVDLPETVEVRRQLLPDTDRHRTLACSALDFRWMREVDDSKGVFITAQGLLMYFDPADVQRLLSGCAEHFQRGTMIFDVIPRWLRMQARLGLYTAGRYRPPEMPWALPVKDIPTLASWHPNIARADEVEIGTGPGFALGVLLPVYRRLTPLWNLRPTIARLTFGAR